MKALHGYPGIRRAMVAASLFVFSVLGLVACGSLLDTERPADVRYWLEPLASGGAQPLAPFRLELELSVVPGLDTERVLMLDRSARLGALGAARWADSLSEVLGSVMARSLAVQGARVAAPYGAKDPETCRLELAFREFFATGSGQPDAVRASVSGRLDCPSEGWQLAAQETRQTTQSADAVVAALQSALDDVTRDISGQIARSRQP